MGRKSRKKSTNRYNLNDIISRFKSGDAEGAVRMIRQTKFKPHEFSKALTIEFELLHFEALEHFYNSDYRAVLETLKKTEEGKFAKYTDRPIEKTKMLRGFAYLYLGEYDAAETFLQTALEQPTTHKFYFYYLLLLVYRGDYNSVEKLSAAMPAQYEALGENRQQYLQIACALVNKDLKEAQFLLEDYKPLSHAHANQIEGLKTILGNAPSSEITGDKLKTLYKAYLNFNLTPIEIQWLKTFPSLQSLVDIIDYKHLTSNIGRVLRKLCEEGIPLSASELDIVLELPKEEHPYLIYNQAVNYFNLNRNEYSQKVSKIIISHEHLFFQVPEAFSLFLEIASFDEDAFSSSFFWRACENSIKHLTSLLNKYQLQLISWQIFRCLLNINYADDRSAKKRMLNLLQICPDLMGVKWWLLLDYIMEDNAFLYTETLDLFTDPAIQTFELAIIESFPGRLEQAFPKEYFFNPWGSDMDEEEKDFIKILQRASEVLIKTTLRQETFPKRKVILDLYKTIHHFSAKFLKECDTPLPENNLDSLTKNYTKTLTELGENHPQSKYYKDWEALKTLPLLSQLSDLINPQLGKQARNKTYKDLIEQGLSSLIQETLLNEVDKTHFDDNCIEYIATYFKMILTLEPEKIEERVTEFGNRYQKLREANNCEHPNEFYCQILKRLMYSLGIGQTAAELIQRLTLVGLDKFTKEMYPKVYNISGELLLYFKKSDIRHKKFTPEPILIHKLLKYVGRVVKKKKLKTLGKTYEQAKKYFGE